MRCETCNSEHDGSFGSGRFCSVACSKTRIWTKEAREAMSLKLRRPVTPQCCRQCGVELFRSLKKERKTSLCVSCYRQSKPRRGLGKYNIDSEDQASYRTHIREQRRKDFIKLLGGKCIRCSYDTYRGALEFHHLDPKAKETGLAGGYLGASLAFLEKEISKCVLLCSNCHREIHDFMRRGGTLEEFLVK